MRHACERDLRKAVRPLWSVAMYLTLTDIAASNGIGRSVVVVGLVCVLAIGCRNSTRLVAGVSLVTSDIGSKDMFGSIDNLRVKGGVFYAPFSI